MSLGEREMIVLFILARYLPESPRWLMSQGRFEEVKSIMKTCAKINGKEFPEHLLPQLEVTRVTFHGGEGTRFFFAHSPQFIIHIIVAFQRKMTENRKCMTSQAKETPKECHKVVGVASLFRTPNMRLKTILITFNWCLLIFLTTKHSSS